MTKQEQFKQYFGRELKEYQTWHGFDLLKFETDVLPDLPKNESIKNEIVKRYGESAKDLILEMLEVQRKTGLNTDLAGFKGASNYLVKGYVTYKDFIQIQVFGEVDYPFGLRKDNVEWKIDHLPTGQYVFNSYDYEYTKKLFDQLSERFKAKMWNDDYSQEVFYELREYIYWNKI